MRFNISLITLIIIYLIPNIAFTMNEEKFTYDSQGKRDPFVAMKEEKGNDEKKEEERALTPAQKLEKLGVVVSSIVYDPVNPAVLIGDSILEIGQEVNGVVIRAVERDYVVFEVEGELVEVPIN